MDNNSVISGSRFLASTLHEIRTPLQTIVSTTELLQDTPLNKEQREYVRQIEFSSDVLLQLANDVLDFAKLSAGEMTMENIPFDISDLVEHVVDLIAMEAFEKGLEIATDIDPYIPKMIMGDPTRMQQVILNLKRATFSSPSRGSRTSFAFRLKIRASVFRKKSRNSYSTNSTRSTLPPQEGLAVRGWGLRYART